MAWSAPMTAVANTAFTAAQFNTYIRDNLLETAPAKATGEGSWFVGNGPNQIVERFWSVDEVSATATTTSTSYTDLASSSGPSVTCATSSRALVILTGNLTTNVKAEYAVMSFAVSGDSTVAAADTNALHIESAVDGDGTNMQASVVVPLSTLTPGNNTFTCKYRVTDGTGTFNHRRILVLPY